ncbi:amidotransferase 1, exosortase A system-associated [Candidatus Berkiella cookevillensis]|uniref:asparagine synthase (glutamine-hydrolyzing) n=1 Tax=Candidatus Berkiella cookevillensis TaxID=437022 RepID=A0A0Q9YBA3_9GAMM|nr:XrtA/PEP-CTERM system amidotransferase [Candidatus Berkiella cookevillensis]MCS5709130.1 amidotransferase 1, exosortase A system-associated [Candidatus Berkiella cookevillensis]
MCGISGIFAYQASKQIDKAVLTAMNHRISHRGPDDEGFHFQSEIALGHRRLSIIDLSTGKQPIYNEDKSVVVVFNGEIYNYIALRNELVSQGHQFQTLTDTEVIVHAYEQWGEACVNRFQGMFAFALWDNLKKSLFIARDRLGIKPLYYSYLRSGMFIFASELKALTAHPDFNFTIDAQSVDEYFTFGYVPDPKTIYKNTFKLAPGHHLTINQSGVMSQPKQYWDLCFEPNIIKESDAIEECLEMLDATVNSHLISDVPIGAFLSGGVDSSAVVSAMSRYTNDIKTCSVVFSEKSHDEAMYAAQLSKLFKTEHQEYRLEPIDVDLLDDFSTLYDEPFADSSAIPTYRVCQVARTRVKVMLSGDGGDETIAGYRRYRFHTREERLKSILPYTIRSPLFGLLGRFYPKLDWAPRYLRAKSTFQALSRDTLSGYMNSIALFKDDYRKLLYHDSFSRQLRDSHPLDVFKEHAQNFQGHSGLALVQYLDMKTYLPGDILTKVDRASMAHGLEVRVPLLDHKWVEWSARLADTLKIKQDDGKYLFKKALCKRLPKEILYRKKQGFAVPLQQWFKGSLRARVYALKESTLLKQSNIFNIKLIDKIVEQHLSATHDHSAMLWSLLVFENFQKKLMCEDYKGNHYVNKKNTASV